MDVPDCGGCCCSPFFLSVFPSPSRLREKKPGGQNMDIMETRFTDSLYFFPSLQYYIYVSFNYFFLILSLSLSPLFIRRRRPLCLVVRKRSRTERCRVSLSRPEPRSFLSLLETTTTTTTEGEGKKEKNFGVCPADSIQHLCVRLLSSVHTVPHGFPIDQTLTKTFLGPHLSSFPRHSKFWE